MNLPAFYLEPEKWHEKMELSGQEARHAHVLRLKPGERVILMDGEGKSGLCEIRQLKRQKIELNLISEEFSPKPLSRAVVALALSKAVRRGFFMEKASELGAASIWLWQAEFSQGKISEQLAENLKGQLIAGMKQSRNPWLPEIRLMKNATEVAEQAAQADYRILPWEEIGGSPMLSFAQLGKEGLTLYVIGPEGGFSPSELECFRAADFTFVSLGQRVLRCETAASLCLGLHWWAAQTIASLENQ